MELCSLEGLPTLSSVTSTTDTGEGLPTLSSVTSTTDTGEVGGIPILLPICRIISPSKILGHYNI